MSILGTTESPPGQIQEDLSWADDMKKKRVLELWSYCYWDNRKVRTEMPTLTEKQEVVKNHRKQLILTATTYGISGVDDEEILQNALNWDGTLSVVKPTIDSLKQRLLQTW